MSLSSSQLPPSADLAAFIDHTLLCPDATHDDIARLCAEANDYRFATVCVNPYWVRLAAKELRGSSARVCTTIGFPLGATSTKAKSAEAAAALRDGAGELDMVLNVGALRGGDEAGAEADIRAVVEAAREAGALVKVILETALLSDEQKVAACRLAESAGADFVKTSTGFAAGGATEHDVRLLRTSVGDRMGVKASAGIRTADDVRRMLAAGASRIGTSAGVAIMRGRENAADAAEY